MSTFQQISRQDAEDYLHEDDICPTSYSFSEEAFESSRPHPLHPDAVRAALLSYHNHQCAITHRKNLRPEEILAMLDRMEHFFTHQALTSSTDILAIHSLRTKTIQIASNNDFPMDEVI